MRELDIDGFTYILGLTWYTASSPGVKKDIKSFISSEGFSHGVIHDYVSEGISKSAIDQLTGIKSGRAYQVGATDDEDSKGNVSLAKLMAKMTRSTGIYCLTVSEKEKWVLAINNGEIITSTDCILPDDEAKLVLHDLAEALIGTHSDETPFVCILDDDELLDIFVDHDEDYVELILRPEQLISSSLIEGDLIALTKQSKIIPLESKTGLLVILLLVVGGGGYYGYGEYSNNKEVQERLREQASRVVESKDVDLVNQDELLAQARVEEINEFNKEFFRYGNISLIESAIRKSSELPPLIAGWYPKELVATSNQIIVIWETKTGTPLGLDEYLAKNFDSHFFNSKGEVANSTININRNSYKSSFDAYNNLPGSRDSIYLVDSLKRLGGPWSLSNPNTKPREHAIEGVVDLRIAMERQAPYRETDINIRGSGVHKLRSYYNTLSEVKSIKVDSVKIDIENNIWELTGVYYDKA